MDFGVKYLDRWTAKYSCDYLTTGFVFKRLTMTTRQQLHVTSEHNFAAVVAVVAADAVELMW